MKKTIIIGSAIAVLWVLFLSSTYAAGWYGRNTNSYAWKNTQSPTFVDANNDWVCDNYANRPQDGTGKHYWRNR